MDTVSESAVEYQTAINSDNKNNSHCGSYLHGVLRDADVGDLTFAGFISHKEADSNKF